MPGLPTDAGEGRSFFDPYGATEVPDSLLRYPSYRLTADNSSQKDDPMVLDEVRLVPSSTAPNSSEMRIQLILLSN
jgi:hypothetical protein